jgi:hypothetical protein
VTITSRPLTNYKGGLNLPALRKHCNHYAVITTQRGKGLEHYAQSRRETAVHRVGFDPSVGCAPNSSPPIKKIDFLLDCFCWQAVADFVHET